MKIFKFIVIFFMATSMLFSSLTFTGCNVANANSVTAISRLATAVIILVDTFAKKTKEFSQKFSDMTRLANDELSNGSSVKDVALFWEDKWAEILDEHSEMKDNLSGILEKANEYFNKLDEITFSIENEGKRGVELSKNESLKKQWEQAYKKTEREIANLDPLISSGNDFMKILKLNTIRQPVMDSMKELRGLSKQAQALGLKITSFEDHARLIFKTN